MASGGAAGGRVKWSTDLEKQCLINNCDKRAWQRVDRDSGEWNVYWTTVGTTHRHVATRAGRSGGETWREGKRERNKGRTKRPVFFSLSFFFPVLSRRLPTCSELFEYNYTEIRAWVAWKESAKSEKNEGKRRKIKRS